MDQNNDIPNLDSPRMSRRNAVQYDNIGSSDANGLLAPGRLSVHEVLEGMENPDLANTQRVNARKSRKVKNVMNSVLPALDGWKRFHDATSNAVPDLVGIVEGAHNKTTKGGILNHEADALTGSHRPIIPWRKQEQKQTTFADERKRIFDSFDLTSAEPPETPTASQAILKKPRNRTKRKEKEDDESADSIRPPSSKKETNPYHYVQAKVVTKWDEGYQRPQTVKDNDPGEKDGKLKINWNPFESTDKMGTSTKQGQYKSGRSVHVDNSKLTTAGKFEPGKYPSTQLPLTISPKYNHRKGMGLQAIGTNSDNLPTVGIPGVGVKRGFLDAQRAGGNNLKSTFINLQRINTGGGGTTPGTSIFAQKTKGFSTTVQNKRPITPVKGQGLTMLHSPMSPFLFSKISIQNQFGEIPINGQKLGMGMGMSRGARQAQLTSYTNRPRPYQLGKFAGMSTTRPLLPNSEKPKPVFAEVKEAHVPKTVVPGLGRAPNKYNNIYITPYSGSESDGETKSKPKNKKR